MGTIGNIVWLFTAGAVLALAWLVVGIIFCISVIGIPFGMQCFKLALFSLWPFGREIVYGGSGVSFILNILWILLFGWEIAVVAVLLGLMLCVTIVFIPFGIQSIKFAKLALMPFGSSIQKI